MSTEKMKQPKTVLEDGEMLIKAAGGGIVIPLLGNLGGGMVYLTNRRVIHEPNLWNKKHEIRLETMAETIVETMGFTIVSLLSFFQKCIAIYQKDGSKLKIYAFNAEGWIVAINEARRTLNA